VQNQFFLEKRVVRFFGGHRFARLGSLERRKMGVYGFLRPTDKGSKKCFLFQKLKFRPKKQSLTRQRNRQFKKNHFFLKNRCFDRFFGRNLNFGKIETFFGSFVSRLQRTVYSCRQSFSRFQPSGFVFTKKTDQYYLSRMEGIFRTLNVIFEQIS